MELLQRAIGGRSTEELRALLADLNLMILTSDRSPSTFQRVTELDQKTALELERQTFLSALTSPTISRKALQALNRYGDLLTQVDLPDDVKLAGLVIHTLASAAMTARFNVPLGDSAVCTVSTVLSALAAAQGLPEAIRTMASQIGGAITALREASYGTPTP